MRLFVDAKSRGHWPRRRYARPRIVYGIMGPVILMGALLICAAPNEATAGVNSGVSSTSGRHQLVIPEPPEVVVVPGSRLYFVSGIAFDVFFYNGLFVESSRRPLVPGTDL